ncbi:LysR family transcriptional regulator [Bradyrhizobium manausense]|nr:LysR family transcriptional regulator [Bradyrhizobium manausense]
MAAAGHGSFRRASEVLLLRQSTLSRCISQLEHSLGMTVFERFSGGVRATMAGRDVLRTARSILEQMDSLAKSTHHVGRGEAGRLSLGFYTSISTGNLRTTLVDFQNRSHRNLPVRAILCLVWSAATRLLTE